MIRLEAQPSTITTHQLAASTITASRPRYALMFADRVLLYLRSLATLAESSWIENHLRACTLQIRSIKVSEVRPIADTLIWMKKLQYIPEAVSTLPCEDQLHPLLLYLPLRCPLAPHRLI